MSLINIKLFLQTKTRAFIPVCNGILANLGENIVVPLDSDEYLSNFDTNVNS